MTSDDEPSTSKRGRIVDPFEPRPLPDGVLYEGYLQKKGHVRHNWKIRWFRVVEGGSTVFVNYFVDDAAPKPKGRVALSPAMAVQPTVHETRRNCFAIFPDAVSNFPLLTMSATCEHERYQWISLLESAIAKLAKRPPPTVV